MFGSPPRVSVLALGTFAAGTSAYVVAGLLPELAGELHVSTAAAAQMGTAFAVAYVVGSPLLAAVTRNWDRRWLLVAALVTTGIGNALAALVSEYGPLLAARVVTAMGAAVFTPAASAVAAELTTPERRGRAVAFVFGGLTVATILGVPLGSLLSQQFGYRMVFLLVAAFSLVSAVAVGMVLPRMTAPATDIRLVDRFTVVSDARVLAMLGATVLVCLAAFTVYTYIIPLLAATAGVHGTTVSVLLFCYGIGGALGNVLGGRATDRWGARRPLLVIFGGVAVVLAVLPIVATTIIGAGVILLLWGLCTWSVNPPIQHRLMELSGHGAGLVLSLNASAIYLGVGLSGPLGGLVLGYGGPTLLPEVAAVLAALGVVPLILGWRARGTGAEKTRKEVAVRE